MMNFVACVREQRRSTNHVRVLKPFTFTFPEMLSYIKIKTLPRVCKYSRLSDFSRVCRISTGALQIMNVGCDVKPLVSG